jgi:pentatricopeptide repeat protein
MWDYLQTAQSTNSSIPADTQHQKQPLPRHDTTLFHDIEIYNILLRAYVAIGTPYGTILHLYDQLVSQSTPQHPINPDSFTFTMLIIAASDSGEMDQANQFFRMMEASEQARLKAIRQTRNRNPRSPMPSTLLKSFTYRSIYGLTYIMAGYLRKKMFQQATEVYEEIQRRGLPLLPLTCAVLLRAYVGRESQEASGGSLGLAEDFLSRIVDADQGLERFHPTFDSSTATQIDESSGPEAMGGVGEGSEMDHSQSDEPTLPRPVWVAGLSRPRARESLTAPVLSEYVRRQDPAQIERILDEVVQVGGEPSISSMTMLMDAQRKIGDHAAVAKTWERIWEVTQVILKEEKALIRLAEKARTAKDLTSSFSNTDSTSNMHRDIATTKHSKQSLLCYPFSIYMDAMSRAGQHGLVADEWQRLRDAGFAFDAHNWNHLVVALVRAGEVERAVEVVERVILAYAEASQRIVLDRDRDRTQVPNSLAGIDEDKEADEGASPAADIVDGDHKWDRRRIKMKSMTRSPLRMAQFEHLSQTTGSDDLTLNRPFDFVHDLHVLQQLNRSWNIWRPHRQVLMVLYQALSHMEQGKPVLAHYPQSQSQPFREEVISPAEVHATLKRIWERYPQTVELVYREHGR